jgi:RNA polymerase sigma-70 factor (ECF subfamily)
MATTLRRIAVDYEPVRLAGDDGGAELEQQLVDRARSGDQVAFETLYRRYVKRIHAFAYRRSHSRELAEDVTAATFERAYRQIERFEWRGGGFGAWLFRMGALHNTVNFDDVDRIEEGEDPARRMMVALGTLNTRYHEAISLRYLAGLSHEEAAEAMGVSKPVMAVTLTRALKALKKAMEKDGNQEGGGIR